MKSKKKQYQVPSFQNLIEDDKLRHTERFYNKKFFHHVSKLGITLDEMHNDIRIQLWKASKGYKATGGASARTYCNRAIQNRYFVLAKRASTDKHNMLVYQAKCSDYDVTEETAESMLMEYEFTRDLIRRLPVHLGELYFAFKEGKLLREIMEETGKPRETIIRDTVHLDIALREYAADVLA